MTDQVSGSTILHNCCMVLQSLVYPDEFEFDASSLPAIDNLCSSGIGFMNVRVRRCPSINFLVKFGKTRRN